MVAYLDAARGSLIVSLVLAVVVVSCGIGGGVGFLIGKGKGRGAMGFWLGALLGFIGWIIVAVMEPTPEDVARRYQAGAVAYGAHMYPPPYGTYGYGAQPAPPGAPGVPHGAEVPYGYGAPPPPASYAETSPRAGAPGEPPADPGIQGH